MSTATQGAFRKGYKARLRFVAMTDNPYPARGGCKYAWQRGHEAAAADTRHGDNDGWYTDRLIEHNED